MKKCILITIISLAYLVQGLSQDALYSLFDRNLILISPALAGDIPNGYLNRVGYQHRLQWFDALREDRYEHFSFAYDKLIPICSSGGTSAVGVGFQVTSESIPYHKVEPNFKTNKLGVDLAYKRALSKFNYLSGGVEIEWLYNRLHTDGLQFPSQYDGLGAIDPNLTSGELFMEMGDANASAFSMGAGIALTLGEIKTKRKNKIPRSLGQLRLGVSIHHLTRPNLSLIGNDNDQEAIISRRWSTFFRWRLPIYKSSKHEPIEFIPYGYYAYQGAGVWQLVGGTDFSFGSSIIPRLIPGFGMRLTNRVVGDKAVTSYVFSLRIDMDHIFIAGATDIEVSSIAGGGNDSRATTLEVALGYRFGKTNVSNRCPTQNCPVF